MSFFVNDAHLISSVVVFLLYAFKPFCKFICDSKVGQAKGKNMMERWVGEGIIQIQQIIY